MKILHFAVNLFFVVAVDNFIAYSKMVHDELAFVGWFAVALMQIFYLIEVAKVEAATKSIDTWSRLADDAIQVLTGVDKRRN